MKISVAIPTYNRPKDVLKAINSVFAQSLKPVEILVHDNSENDDTERALSGLIGREIKYYRHPRNVGQRENWNSLLRACAGDYVKFLNDDDLLEPYCLEVFSSQNNKRYGIMTCRATYFDPDGDLDGYKTDIVSGDGRDYSVSNTSAARLWLEDALPLRTPSHSIYSREFALKLGGFDEPYPYGRDVLFGLKLACLGGAYFFESRPLIRYAMHPAQFARHIDFKNRVYDLQEVKKWAGKNLQDAKEIDISKSLAVTSIRETALMMKAGRLAEFSEGLRCSMPFGSRCIGAFFKVVNRELFPQRFWKQFDRFRIYS